MQCSTVTSRISRSEILCTSAKSTEMHGVQLIAALGWIFAVYVNTLPARFALPARWSIASQASGEHAEVIHPSAESLVIPLRWAHHADDCFTGPQTPIYSSALQIALRHSRPRHESGLRLRGCSLLDSSVAGLCDASVDTTTLVYVSPSHPPSAI